MSEIRVRFAPSPTGYLHVGGARTALFNYLYAKNTGGKFILRIEDTDLARSTDESINAILRSMKWLGLDWDEGPEKGGEFGPYFQTQRLDTYNKYAAQLLESGHAYYCFCSQQEKKDDAEAQGSKYPGTCRAISLADAKKRLAAGEKAAIRFKMPAKEIKFKDIVRGEVSFDGSLFGDMVIIRQDGVPTYNYAVVIDDALMNITHVLRGDDHISNTPKQIAIYEAIGFKMPEFGHISMILGPDGSRLSKRHGATSVEEYNKNGILPEAFVNYLALLGWSPEGDREIFPLEEMIKEFSLSRVSKSAAIFDSTKLKWMNGMYIRSLSDDQLLERVLPFMISEGLISAEEAETKKEWLLKIVKTIKNSFDLLTEAPAKAALFFGEDYEIKTDDPEVAKYIENKEITGKALGFIIEELNAMPEYGPAAVKAAIKKAQKTLGFSGHDVFMPLRVSLTGLSGGPGVYDMFDILGKERVTLRLNNFLKKYTA
ncbi:MAG TPA: glutamate--tRNA ligase [Candidatus Wallbacteria bacterium]|nr:glutamate--tRNA ligase [Candidatus Wallbacteria bacterium]